MQPSRKHRGSSCGGQAFARCAAAQLWHAVTGCCVGVSEATLGSMLQVSQRQVTEVCLFAWGCFPEPAYVLLYALHGCHVYLPVFQISLLIFCVDMLS